MIIQIFLYTVYSVNSTIVPYIRRNSDIYYGFVYNEWHQTKYMERRGILEIYNIGILLGRLYSLKRIHDNKTMIVIGVYKSFFLS